MTLKTVSTKSSALSLYYLVTHSSAMLKTSQFPTVN